MPSEFFAGHFHLKTKENAVISYLFYPSISRYRLFMAKKGKTVAPARTLQAKGERCTLQTGKLCYNAININYFLVIVYVQNCKRAQSLVCHGPS